MKHADPGAAAAEATESSEALLATLARLRAEVSSLTLSLDVPGVAAMRREREAVLELLDGYQVGRLSEGERPLLVVIGGPTGAGKSTLLNSLIGKDVTQAGVLRPTTLNPVMLHHPDDAAVARRLLPSLIATAQGIGVVSSGRGRRAEHADDGPLGTTIELVEDAEVAPGLVILDSPDLDSWMQSNRDLAVRMLQVADLWLFVTTGTDYADGVPWELLRAAVARRVSVATVINRLRRKEAKTVPRHFAEMLVAEGLSEAPVLRVPEVNLVDDRIPYRYVLPLQKWLARQSHEVNLREAYVERATEGSLDQVITTIRRLIAAAADQVVTDRRLRVDLGSLFDQARTAVGDGVADGRVSRALDARWVEAANWQQSRAGARLLRALSDAFGSAETPYAAVGEGLTEALTDLVEAKIQVALVLVVERWRRHPAAASIQLRGLDEQLPATPARIQAAVRSWLGDIQAGLGLDQRGAHTDNWHPLTLAVATLAVSDQQGSTPADAGVATPGGTSGETSEPSARTLAAQVAREVDPVSVTAARAALLERLDSVIAAEEGRLAALLDETHVSPMIGGRLRTELKELERLRAEVFDGGTMTAVPDQ